MKGEMATTTNKKSLVKPEHYVYPHITKIPGVCGGEATIDGRRVRVMDIVVLLQQGYTPQQMLEDYDFLSLAQIHAALAYYYDHQEEIEALFEADRKWDEKVTREWDEYLARHGGKEPDPPPPDRPLVKVIRVKRNG